MPFVHRLHLQYNYPKISTGFAPQNNETKPFIGFWDLIKELQVYAQYNIKMRLRDTIQCSQFLTNTFHLASSFNATAKRTLRGMIWGSTSSEELKIRTM